MSTHLIKKIEALLQMILCGFRLHIQKSSDAESVNIMTADRAELLTGITQRMIFAVGQKGEENE